MSKVCSGNKILCNIEATGDVLIKIEDGLIRFIKHIGHVPDHGMNLVSFGKLDDEGCHIVFGKGR
jgi:hypothetical protein